MKCAVVYAFPLPKWYMFWKFGVYWEFVEDGFEQYDLGLRVYLESTANHTNWNGSSDGWMGNYSNNWNNTDNASAHSTDWKSSEHTA